jgi:hypothetical protein
VFLIVKADNDPGVSSAQSGLWNTSTDSNNTHYPFTDGIIYDSTGSSARKTVGNPAAALTSWRVVEVVTKSGSWTYWLDGTQLFTTGTNTVSFGNNAKLGQSVTTPFLVGYVAGMYLYSAELSAPDRAVLVSYINTRFGLSMV